MTNTKYNVALSPLKNKSFHIGNTVYGFRNASLTWEELGEAIKENAMLTCILDEYYGKEQDWKPSETYTLGYGNLLVLDFDNESAEEYVSIKDWATNKAYNFMWYLATTKSHGTEKAKGRDRYRLYIPLEKPLLFMNSGEFIIFIQLFLRALDIGEVDGEPCDVKSAITGKMPKFEAPPFDCTMIQSHNNTTVINTEELQKLAARMYYSNSEVLPDNLPEFTMGRDMGIMILTEGYDEVLLSSFTENTQCFCPQCESKDSKTPSATVYIQENGKPYVYCHKQGCTTYIDSKGIN